MGINDDRWHARLDRLTAWIDTHGDFPRRTDGEERSLCLWLAEQRRFDRAGTLGGNRRRLLAEIPGALLERAPDRLGQLADFHAEHGRLPRTTGTDPQERALGAYLVHNLRVSIKTGRINSERLDRARAIPGVTELRPVPDQLEMLKELRSYVADRGHLPVRSGRNTEAERRLSDWVRNNLTGDPREKSPARRERHLAIQAVADSAVPRSSSKLADIEAFCAEHGHLPSRSEDQSLGAALAVCRRKCADGLLDQVSAQRLKRILRYPTLSEHRWMDNLEEIKGFVADHGRLPTGPADGRIYTWLAVQRRENRRGNLDAGRTGLLLEVPGILPDTVRRAA